MTDDHPKPLEAVGDEALEARIVAWVLGEASPFEAAELEKRCAGDPEAALFARRMRMLDGLVREGGGGAERLSEEKRSRLLEVMGEAPEGEHDRAIPVAPARLERPVRNWRRAVLRRLPTVAAVLVLLVVIGGLTAPMVLRQQKSAARMEGVIASYSAAEDREVSLMKVAEAEAASRGGTVLPKALIEGTPKPIILPQQTPGSRRAGEPTRPVGGIVSGGVRSGDAAVTRSSVDAILNHSRWNSDGDSPGETMVERKPSTPSSSTARAIAANTAAPGRIPVPEIEGREMATQFGDGDDFGAGWGGAPDEPGVGGESPPSLGDVPALGRLFADKQKEMSTPQGGEMTNGVNFQFNLSGERDLSGQFEAGNTDTGRLAGDENAKADADFDGFANLGAPILGTDAVDEPVVDPFAAPADRADYGYSSLAEREMIRRGGTLTQEHAAKVDKVRRKLYEGGGNHDLGKFDEAKQAYEEVLRIDPYNQAARRGMEKVAESKSSYYRAAYDQTRTELLAEVDAAWETAVPADDRLKSEMAEIRKALEEPSVSDSNKQELYRQWRERNEELKMSDESRRLDVEEDEAVTAGIARYGVEDAKSDFESAQSLLEQLKVKLVGEEMQRRSELEDQRAERALEELKEAVRSQEDLVEEKRKLLTQIIRNEDVLYQRKDALDAPVEAPAIRVSAKEQQKQALDLMAEVAAGEEPFSTFSLHVSDASFKLAVAALARGERPEAAGIRPEEFYNAFDYGDPAPSDGQPVACTLEQAAHPAFPQRNLLRIAVRTGAAGRAQSVPLNLTLLLDNSGSMERADRSEGVARAVAQLATLLKAGDTVTVAGFSRTPRLLADRLDGARAAELNEIVRQVPAEGGTNLEQALLLGEELATRQHVAGAQNRVVLFTDGAANLGDADPESLNGRVETLRQNGIAFDAAGFGADGLNDRLLERLTRNGNGRYYVVDHPSEADEGFADKLAGAFRPAAENVKVQVVFNPERVGRYKLIGFEEHRLKKEDFRDDTVDAAEMASEEAGVALYQMEVLPEGRGEVGEVRVRFRDAASGAMVERSWTIPYEPDAPAFDQAAESIQLAALAAFAAEKLRDAPMAGLVDFKELAPAIGRVTARYAENDRVAELRRVIEVVISDQ